MKSRYFLLLLLPLIFAISCQDKGTETDFNPNVKSSRDYIYAEDLIFDIIDVFFKGITDSAVVNSGYAYIDNCAIFSHPNENMIQFDYGDVNRYCPDNKFRRGRYYTYFSGDIFEPGTTVTFTMDSLIVDEVLVEGEVSAEFLGVNTDGKQQFTFDFANGLITFPDTVKVITIGIDVNYDITWEEGQQTPDIHEDDMLLVTGSGSGLSKDKFEFQTSVQEPLNDYLDCNWISSGIYQITTPAGTVTTGTIDYITEDGCNYLVNFYFDGNLFYDNLKF